MARTIRKFGVKEVPLSEIKDDLSGFLREAETQEIVITRHGKPAGVLIDFESEEDWFEYRREHNPRLPHIRPALLRTAIVRSAISRINPISVISLPSASAFATSANSRQHRSASRGASRIHRAVRRTISVHLPRYRARTLCKR